MKERFRALRTALGLTQADFAERLHVSTSAINKLEKGVNNPSDQTIALILSAFPQVSEEWLRSGSGDMFRKESSNFADEIARRYDFHGLVRDLYNSVVKKYDALDPVQRAMVDQYIQSVIVDMSGHFDPEIHDKVASYEQELIAEKGEQEKSSASQTSEDVI